MSRKKVLFIAPHNEKGGIGSVLQLYGSYLNNNEILYTYPENKSNWKNFYFFQSLLKLIYKLSTDKQISIVHIHTASYGSFYRKSIVLVLAKIFAKKTILHIHGGGFKQFLERSYGKGKWQVSILKLADLNICLSEEWYTYFISQWRINNCVVLPNPIVIPLYHEHRVDQNKLVLLYLGAIVEQKGIFDLIEFFSTYRYFLEGKLELHIGGEGELQRLRYLIDKCNMNKQIHIHGWLNENQKELLFQEAHLFILPSYAEGLPVSILEAMANGKPIIATNVGGIPSIVKSKENGWLFEPGCFNELTSILDELYINPELLVAYGKQSYRLAEAFDIKIIVQQLEELYKQISSH